LERHRAMRQVPHVLEPLAQEEVHEQSKIITQRRKQERKERERERERRNVEREYNHLAYEFNNK
jgi:hypothetical protein